MFFFCIFRIFKHSMIVVRFPGETVAEKLKRKPTKTELLELSKLIVEQWTNVAERLGLCNYNDIKIDYRDDVTKQSLEMLKRWKMKKAAGASVHTLCDALHLEGLNEIVVAVFDVDVMSL
eukprot:m.99095 g.99095  ORF g.99095 m.99095 type:complete len:120 (+) comp37038_c0_seq2:2741-3100(+)